MSLITAAAQSRPESVVLKTISVMDIATEHKAIDVSFIANPKNCGYDYLWFDNGQQENNIIKVKIGKKVADTMTNLTATQKMTKLIQDKTPIYVNTEDKEGTPYKRPIFTFGPAGGNFTTVKVTIAELFGQQTPMGVK
jgi:hypothetical protein